MDNPDPLVFKTSDTRFGQPKNKSTHLDWLTDFFEKEDDEESDEVVVLGDIQSIPNTPFIDNNDSDSDDCLMLDGDPDDNLVQVSANGDGLEEELCIVGEKGQLACRDYPHPRHLCARFPFSTTSHVKCCDMCHCYVCDTPAPCIYWGNGVSVGDHCHSSDKEDIWVRKRKRCNEMKTAQQPPETLCSIRLHESIPIQNILEFLHCDKGLVYTPEQMEIAQKLYKIGLLIDLPSYKFVAEQPFLQSSNGGSILSYTPEQMKLVQKLSKAIHLVGLDVPDIQNSLL